MSKILCPGSLKKRDRRWHRYNTDWLGDKVSLSDIDMSGEGRLGINIWEMKQRIPMINLVQKDLFLSTNIYHIVVFDEGKMVDGLYSFEADHYRVYCPEVPHDVKYVPKPKKWLLVSKPTIIISHDEAYLIFTGEALWPCCKKMTTSREHMELRHKRLYPNGSYLGLWGTNDFQKQKCEPQLHMW